MGLLDFLHQLAIPSHLLHETQCIEGCRTDSGYGEEGFSVLDKQENKCFCVAKGSVWAALADPMAAIPTPITQQDCYKFRYKVCKHPFKNMTVVKLGQVHQVELIPKAKNCDELFFERQVYWWEPAYMLTEMGEAYCHWAEPTSQSPNGNWNQKAEKMAHLPLMFTDELSHTDPDNGIRVLPYDLSVRLLCN